MINNGAFERSYQANNLKPAQLETITFSALAETDPDECEKLFQACRFDGFFYLDMRETHDDLLSAIEEIYQLEHRLFQLPSTELMQYDVDRLSSSKLNGYKPLGRNRAGLKTGKDGFETYVVSDNVPFQSVSLFATSPTYTVKIPKDGILSLSRGPWPHPEIIDAYSNALRTFFIATNSASQVILSALSTSLRIPQSSSNLQSLHRSADVCTPDMVRLLRYHALATKDTGVSHIAHTDLGSLTFLCTRQWGLQVQRQRKPPLSSPRVLTKESEAESWEFVAPPPEGHMIVNLGDMMSMLTGGILKSCVHRVIPVPGHEEEERWSFARFVRAEEDVLMKTVNTPLLQRRSPQRTRAEHGNEVHESSIDGDFNRRVLCKAEWERSDHDRQAGDLAGDLMTSGQWLQRKFMMLRGETWTKEENWVLRGHKSTPVS